MDKQKKKIISDICPFYKEYGTCEQCNTALAIDDEPCYWECIANVILRNNYRKQIEGKWIIHNCTNGKASPKGRTIIYKIYTCDLCGKSNGRHKTNYCPNCGAKMKG